MVLEYSTTRQHHNYLRTPKVQQHCARRRDARPSQDKTKSRNYGSPPPRCCCLPTDVASDFATSSPTCCTALHMLEYRGWWRCESSVYYWMASAFAMPVPVCMHVCVLCNYLVLARVRRVRATTESPHSIHVYVCTRSQKPNGSRTNERTEENVLCM